MLKGKVNTQEQKWLSTSLIRSSSTRATLCQEKPKQLVSWEHKSGEAVVRVTGCVGSEAAPISQASNPPPPTWAAAGATTPGSSSCPESRNQSEPLPHLQGNNFKWKQFTRLLHYIENKHHIFHKNGEIIKNIVTFKNV